MADRAVARNRPRLGQHSPLAMGTRQPRKSLCSPKSTSYMFYRETEEVFIYW
ncbi:hypothetical protein PAMP_014106 [Pampus punctatissimus]